jgi:hypothetical protein
MSSLLNAFELGCAWLFQSQEWFKLLRIPSTISNVQRPKSAKAPIILEPKEKPERKRRRKNEPDVVMCFPSIIAPSPITNLIPEAPESLACGIVNALSLMLPMDAQLNMFGFLHSVVLVSVMYKYQNLSWIVLNRVNFELYVASHFIADASHLFAKNREKLDVLSKKKWQRQGLNEILCLALSASDRANKKFIKLNALPKGVLRLAKTQQCYCDLLEFIKGVGSSNNFLQRFKRMNMLPPGFSLMDENLCDCSKGWRVFKKDSDDCSSCSCREINIVKGENLKDSITNLMGSIPSALELNHSPIVAHFAPFVDFVKTHPDILFFPQQDKHIPSIDAL